jgi:hypothetical protein
MVLTIISDTAAQGQHPASLTFTGFHLLFIEIGL